MSESEDLTSRPATMASLSRALERRMDARQRGEVDHVAATYLAAVVLAIGGIGVLLSRHMGEPSIELKKSEWVCVDKDTRLQIEDRLLIPKDYCLNYKRIGEKGVTATDAVMETGAEAVSSEGAESAAPRERQR